MPLFLRSVGAQAQAESKGGTPTKRTNNHFFDKNEVNVKIPACRQRRRFCQDTNELVCSLQERTHKNGYVTDSKGSTAPYREVYL